jgi:uncharacterized protein
VLDLLRKVLTAVKRSHRFDRGEEKVVELKIVKVDVPDGTNVILGQSHFIKTVEDIHETLVNCVPGIEFGFAFCESSGPRLVRSSGTKEDLSKLAEQSALAIGAGHSFVLYLRKSFPINVLNALKTVPEICNIFCATSNPLQVIVAESDQGRGILGVIDGGSPLGVETQNDIQERQAFLRRIGYKL